LIITTTEQIQNSDIVETFGLISASSIRARHIGRDIMAGIRNLVGGEVLEYTRLMEQSREEALKRLEQRAEGKGANAIIGMRFMTSMVMNGAAEILVYGTAVRIVNKKT
tara:strand:+ start:1526 stop:1852 length:327 start_codon:yes stop_codon:yes gene_type:complete